MGHFGTGKFRSLFAFPNQLVGMRQAIVEVLDAEIVQGLEPIEGMTNTNNELCFGPVGSEQAHNIFSSINVRRALVASLIVAVGQLVIESSNERVRFVVNQGPHFLLDALNFWMLSQPRHERGGTTFSKANNGKIE